MSPFKIYIYSLLVVLMSNASFAQSAIFDFLNQDYVVSTKFDKGSKKILKKLKSIDSNFTMVDDAKLFEPGCVLIDKNFSHRFMLFSGQNGENNFIYYKQGGKNGICHVLVLLTCDNKGNVVHVEKYRIYGEAESLEDLKANVADMKFKPY